MLIESDKYQPTSLRRGRKQALEKDLHDSYTLFAYRYSDPCSLTINDYLDFWQVSQLSLLIVTRNQEEDEQQYFQFFEDSADYFLRGNQSKKIFAIFGLYFFAYSVDNLGDRNPRPIHVTAQFITALTFFVRQYSESHCKSLFMKIIKKIRELFIYSIKTGLRDPLIKKNGDTLIRYPKPVRKLPKNNYSPALFQIKKILPSLSQSVNSYHQAKQAFLHQLIDQQQESIIRRQFIFDKNIGLRLNNILKTYQSDVFDEGNEDDQN